MILTVTLNPAIDVTYQVRTLQPGEVHRVSSVTTRAGGKGVNVARVLQQLGVPVTVTGLTGGTVAPAFVSELSDAGLTVELVDALPDIRRTVVVHGTGGVTTSFWEPGRRPADPVGAADALLERCAQLLPRVEALVVSGSLPAGVDAGVPARLASLAASAGKCAVVDADGEPLRLAAEGRQSVLMPNREELARLTGASVTTLEEAVVATGQLSAAGVPAVIATLGSDGMVARSGEAVWWARPVQLIEGNPTGAGDAAAAAVAAGLAIGQEASGCMADWGAVLANAVALSAAAVLRPVAGEVDLDAYERWRGQVRVETRKSR